MKLFSFFFLIALLPLVLAAKRLTSVIVTYPDNTPDSVISQDKQDLVDAGGVITHSYNILKGFSAQAPVDAVHSLSTQSSEYRPTIEDDSIVTVYGDDSE